MKNNYMYQRMMKRECFRWKVREVLFCLLLLFPFCANSQSYSSSHPPKIEQLEKDNDYQIKYRMSLPKSFSKCKGHHWEKKKPIRLDGSNWIEFGSKSGGWGSKTVTIDLYPGGSVKAGGKYWSSSTLFNCHKWSTRVQWMSTANLKQPYNFQTLYEEEERRIVLRWNNATNVPDSKYKIKIKRIDLKTNTEIDTQLDGGETSYIDNRNITPGAQFRYEIRTYHPGSYSVLGRSAPERYSGTVKKEIELPGIISNYIVDTRRTSIKFSYDIRNTIFHDRIRLEFWDDSNWNLIEELTETTDQYIWTPSFALVPGDNYRFRVRAMDGVNEIQQLQGSGGLSSNGVLSGHVKIANSEKGVPYVPIKIETRNEYRVAYKYFNLEGNGDRSVHTMENLNPTKTGFLNNFNISPRQSSTDFGFIFESYIKISKAGNYTFYINSDDAGKIFINDTEWVDNDMHHGPIEKSKTDYLDVGYHKIKVMYKQGTGGYTFVVRYKGPGISKRNIPADVLFEKLPIEINTETDEEGYFYVDEIYYGEEADFNIIPLKDGADFRPDTIVRTLSVSDYKQDDIRIEDFSSIPVYGKILNGECAVKDATVVFNGEKTETKTKADGSFEYIIQSPDPNEANSLDLFYKNHTITGKLNLDLTNDVRNEKNPHIFRDIQKDTLILSVWSGCKKPIADEVDVEIFSANESGNVCKSFTVTLDNTGVDTLYLPAMKYTARVADLRVTNGAATEQDLFDFESVKSNIISDLGEMQFDLSQRDTVKNERIEILNEKTGEYKVHNEVVAINLVKAPFVFRQDIKFDIEGDVWNTPTCTHQIEVSGETKNENVYVVEQGNEYGMKFKLQEYFDYYRIMAHQCGVDSASVLINDNVSDRNQVRRTIVDGTLSYNMIPGEANLDGDWNEERGFQKSITVTASVPNYKKELYDQKWALVTGHKILEPAFITSELHLPEFILHDPPGDASYSFLEEGSTFTSGVKYKNMLSVGFEMDMKGLVQVLSGPICIGIGGYGNLKVGGGFDGENSETYTTTFNEKLTTSKGLIEPGEGSDLIIGSGLNFIYSKSKELSFNCLNGPQVNPAYTVSPGFHTRYALSVYHIRNHVIPTLDALLTEIQQLEELVSAGTKISEEDAFLVATKDVFVKSKANWKKILGDNRRQIFMGGDRLGSDESSISNLTFSGGSAYDYTASKDTTISSSITSFWEVTAKTGFAMKLGDKDAKYNVLDLKVGIYGKGKGTETSIEKDVTKFKQGFHLQDKSVGDFFTVNVTKDPTYGTYMFQTVSGRSCCPNEPGTQSRDRVAMSVVSNPDLRNLPKGKRAVYKIRIDNDSQSEEGRMYAICSLGGQNDGTKIYCGANKVLPLGKNYPFFLSASESNEFLVEVTPGSKTTSKNVQLLAIPDCMLSMYKKEDLLKMVEDELAKTPADISKVDLYASWESNCDQIQIDSPNDGFVVNTSMDDNLPLTISGFDPNSEDISYMEIEYRSSSSFDWNRLLYIDKAAIGDYPEKHLSLGVDTLSAGDYYVRAKVYCSALNATNYSNVIKGKVDHNAFVVVSSNVDDGRLMSNSLNIVFNKPLAQARLKLERYNLAEDAIEHVEYVDAIIRGDEIQVYIPQIHLYEGRKYNAVIESEYFISEEGINLATDKTYTFYVDQAQARWKVANKVAIVVKSQTTNFTANLVNYDIEDVPFEITSNSLSNYITPQYNEGVIPANGEYPVIFDVNEEVDIPVGIFKGTVVAKLTIDGQHYQKELAVELRVKSIGPDWKQPEPKAYRMHVIGQFTPSASADQPLSVDEKDYIAAFIDGELAGVSKVYWNEEANRHLAFVTVESDHIDKTVEFKMWDDSKNTLYSAKEKIELTPNKVIGTYSAPFILHALGAEQSILLQKGWNFISFNVIPSDKSLANVLKDLNQTNNQIKQISDGFSVYNEDANQWSGSLSEVDENKAYMVYVEAENVLKVAGELNDKVNVFEMSSYVENDVNWLAVHSNEVKSLKDGLTTENLSDGVVVRSADRFAVLNDNKTKWIGNLSDLEPGQGYEIFDTNKLNANMAEQNAKLRLSMTVKSGKISAGIVKLHVCVGGDTLNLYSSDKKNAMPKSLLDEVVTVNGNNSSGVRKVINLWERGITPMDFMNNHLLFYLRESDQLNCSLSDNIDDLLECEDIRLEVLDQAENLLETYDYSKLMKSCGITNRQLQCSTGEKLLKRYVDRKKHHQMVGEDSDFRMERCDATSANYKGAKLDTNKEAASATLRKKGPFSMTLIAKSYLNGMAVEASRYTLEVLMDEKPVVRNYLSTSDMTLNNYQMLMIKAKENEEYSSLNFRLIDNKTGKALVAEQEVNFINNGLLGSLDAPFRIDFGTTNDDSNSLQVWPNPVVNGEHLQVGIHTDKIVNGDVFVRITNGVGKDIYHRKISAERSVIETQGWSPGVYIITAYQFKEKIGEIKLLVK
ncbi:hypothetical protein EMN47_17805 [Prolixibacteraceae bacterium JC049]|nr:hypothetical protein [Prolixibacteraceae bacterium JC049]